ncbi:type IV pilus biogenesis protein PilM [Bacillus sp. FJAT-45350]|uniref:type IV pilus biogenesis protein PilM n=1 Tax=Bacillus sp. FJAT-45350 TaxID=2011014 RepID=UPI000BB90230|nr:pilus assembly protein PilM [Bacillus sp. FJAT-45350]
MNLFQSKKDMRTSIIIKDHVIRYVHAKKPSLDSIRSFGERFLPEGVIREGQIIDRETLEIIFEECIEHWKIKRHAIQFCVPDSFVVVRNILIPKEVAEDDIRMHLHMEMGESIHLPFENPSFDFKLLGEKDGQKEILLIASPEKVVMELYEFLSELKLQPNVADVSSLSLYRLFTKVDKALSDEHLLLVQLDRSSINLTVFYSHKPMFTRHFRLNSDDEKWAIKGDVEMESLVWEGEIEEIDGQAEELITEVERVMNFYRFSVHKGKEGVNRIAITGDHPYLERMIDICKESFDLPVETLLDVEIISATGAIPYQFHDTVGLMLKKEVR